MPLDEGRTCTMPLPSSIVQNHRCDNSSHESLHLGSAFAVGRCRLDPSPKSVETCIVRPRSLTALIDLLYSPWHVPLHTPLPVLTRVVRNPSIAAPIIVGSERHNLHLSLLNSTSGVLTAERRALCSILYYSCINNWPTKDSVCGIFEEPPLQMDEPRRKLVSL